MEITKTLEKDTLKIALVGKLDTVTAPDLEKELSLSLGDVSHLELDFAGLEYLSSAGLRVLLNTQKIMSKQGTMVIKNVNDMIMDVFEMTGFINVLTIE